MHINDYHIASLMHILWDIVFWILFYTVRTPSGAQHKNMVANSVKYTLFKISDDPFPGQRITYSLAFSRLPPSPLGTSLIKLWAP